MDNNNWIGGIISGLTYAAEAQEGPRKIVRSMLAMVASVDSETTKIADDLWMRTTHAHTTPTPEEWSAASEQLRAIRVARKRAEGVASDTALKFALRADKYSYSPGDPWFTEAEAARVAHRRAQAMEAAADAALQAVDAAAGDPHAYTRLGWACQRAIGASAAAAHTVTTFGGDCHVYDAAVVEWRRTVALAFVA